jgi:hypothetical protein
MALARAIIVDHSRACGRWDEALTPWGQPGFPASNPAKCQVFEQV